MERDIHLPGLTFKQGKKDMTKTYGLLLAQLLKIHPNKYQDKRTTAYETPDIINTGTRLYTTGATKEFNENSQADVRKRGRKRIGMIWMLRQGIIVHEW